MPRIDSGSPQMAQIRLSNSTFSFLSQGAIIQEFRVAGHNLVLSLPSPEAYLTAQYFGETIGRVANRISQGLIQSLNGRSYSLSVNLAGEHHLHGGDEGWGHRIFSGPHEVTRNGSNAIQFTYLSHDGEEGYPGTVELRVWYTAREDPGEVTVLDIEYEAELVGEECQETVINVTNHSYFCLSKEPTVTGTEVNLASNNFLMTDVNGIPTGEIVAMDKFRTNQNFILGTEEPSIDNCFVMDLNPSEVPLDTRSRELRRLVSARHTSTGIHLEVSSTEPCFQFYTGDYIDVPTPRAGFCVEPGRCINAVNVPQWRNQVVLPRGRLWGSRIVYKAWKA